MDDWRLKLVEVRREALEAELLAVMHESLLPVNAWHRHQTPKRIVCFGCLLRFVGLGKYHVFRWKQWVVDLDGHFLFSISRTHAFLISTLSGIKIQKGCKSKRVTVCIWSKRIT
jgi:hypothetical protein